MHPTPEHVVEKMPYDWRVHAHMTRLRVGIRNFDDSRELAVGDHVTDQFGAAESFVGEVVNPDAGDEQVKVRWLSDHIGPRRTTTVPRHRLVKADYAPPRDFDDGAHAGNGSTAWLLSAAQHGWHVDGSSVTGATETSKGHDGWADAWLRGTKVSVRFNAVGEITWARVIDVNGSGPYGCVKEGKGAGRSAMMWLTPRIDTLEPLTESAARPRGEMRLASLDLGAELAGLPEKNVASCWCQGWRSCLVSGLDSAHAKSRSCQRKSDYGSNGCSAGRSSAQKRLSMLVCRIPTHSKTSRTARSR